MSTYELHGRLIEGPLHEPVRNESRSFGADDWDAVRRVADRWAGAGFTVWIYEHSGAPSFPTASDLRVIDVVHPAT